ncbi:MAG: peptidoglycan recognition protein family protein [Sarcina sp.]
MATKVRRRKKRLPKRVYIIRRILALAILLLFIAIIGLIISCFFKDKGGNLKYSYDSMIDEAELDELRMNLNIKEKEYQWTDKLDYSNKPNKIIIHHSASKNVTEEIIDKEHREKGWSGIGYHFLITKEGEIVRGRPENAIGAHAYKNNINTIGICLEGNFEEELVTEVAYKSLLNTVEYITLKYSIKEILGHEDTYETLCPGKNLKIDQLNNDLIKKIKTEKNKK